MERLVALIMAGCVFISAGSARAQDAFGNVIADQLDAFNDRDVSEAFKFASPMIKRIFGGPDNFGIMVQRAFPMIWDNSAVRFLEQRQEGGALLQRVIVTGKDGIAYVFDYVPRGHPARRGSHWGDCFHGCKSGVNNERKLYR